jgi:DNA-binding NarL/FixJ family response regulator
VSAVADLLDQAETTRPTVPAVTARSGQRIVADRPRPAIDVLVVGPRLTSVGLVSAFPSDRYSLRAVADTGAAALEYARGHRPDVIVVVLSPLDEPAEVLDRLLARPDAGPIVAVFVEPPTRPVTMAVIERRVAGFQLLADGADAIVAAVEAVRRGQPALHPMATQCLLDAWNRRTSATSATDVLTAREHEVLRLVVGGLQNKQIARRLAITEGTVKCHLSRIYQAIGVHSRTEAALWLAEHEVCDSGSPLQRSAS